MTCFKLSSNIILAYILSLQRPWHEFDNNFAIMYRVGGGGIPRISENHLNKEGHDFLSRCLQQNAKDRSTANELLEHQFLKVTQYQEGHDACLYYIFNTF